MSNVTHVLVECVCRMDRDSYDESLVDPEVFELTSVPYKAPREESGELLSLSDDTWNRADQ